MERPDAGGRAAVFVQHAEAAEVVSAALKNGSGMVGFGNPDGSVTVYFENNKFGDASLLPWQAKVFKAYDRMVKRAPTVNKLVCDSSDLEQVGLMRGGEILVTDMALLTGWLERSGAAGSAPASAEITG